MNIDLGGNTLTNGYFAGLLTVTTPVTLPYASTLTVNSSLVTIGRCILTGDVLVAAPTSPQDGAKLELWLTADSGGSNLSFDTPIIIPSLSTFTNPMALVGSKTYIILLKRDKTAAPKLRRQGRSQVKLGNEGSIA